MRPSRLILVVLAALLATAQGAAAPRPRIIGGVDAAPGAWPAQVSVRINPGGGVTSSCGGTRRHAFGHVGHNGDSATLTLKLTKRAKAALRNRARATISVVTTLKAGSVTLPGKAPVSVRR